MARLKGVMVDITYDDLEKMDALLEYCETLTGMAKWMGVSVSALRKWFTARTIEGVQFREQARTKINKLFGELNVDEPVELDQSRFAGIVVSEARAPVFNGDHPLMDAYKLARGMSKQHDGEVGKTLRLISDTLAHQILETQ